MIEVKLSDEVISKTLRKFKTQYQYTAIQLVKNLKKEYQEDGIQVLKAEKFLEQLFL
jgi:ribosomal protein S21